VRSRRREDASEGAIKNVKLAYHVATVETPEHYHQIITWTLLSRKDKNRPVLQNVIDSFKIVPEK